MPRPDVLVVVTGTGTDVGKTWLTARLAEHLRAGGLQVSARKPAQSFDPADPTTDAATLAAATGEEPEAVCPPERWYPIPLAPPMAADALCRAPIAVDDLVSEIDWPSGTEVGFVEGAGGLCSPIAHDGDTLALAAALRPDVVLLVADPALGVVSNVRLTALALRAQGLTDPLVVLNRYDPDDEVHRRSRRWLSNVDGLSVTTQDDLGTTAEALTRLTASAV